MGHKSFECPSKPIASFEDMADKCHEEEPSMDDSCWLLMDHDADGLDDDWQVHNKKKKGATSEDKELCVIEEVKGSWVRVSAGMDSCAATTVMSKRMFPKLPIEQTDDSMNDKEYTAANGGK